MELRCPICEAVFTARTIGDDVRGTLITVTCPRCGGMGTKHGLASSRTMPWVIRMEREQK